MTIDVAVPTWNRADLLESCLDHLNRQATPHRVIVADNGSEDDTVAMVRRRFPEVLLVELQENLGFGRAVNRAVQAGSGDLIVLINNDVNVQPGFLAEIVKPLSRSDRVGMASGVLTDPGTGLIDAAGVEVDGSLAGYAYLGGRALDELARPQPGLLGPCGGAAAFLRSAFEQVDGFDERIFAYSEDVDLALRLRAAGWDCAFAPRAIGVHLGSATLGQRSVTQTEIAARSRGYVMRRYRVTPGWTAIEAGVALTDTAVLRSPVPVSGRIRGWRSAKGLPPRPLPANTPALVTRREALRRRLRSAFPRA